MPTVRVSRRLRIGLMLHRSKDDGSALWNYGPQIRLCWLECGLSFCEVPSAQCTGRFEPFELIARLTMQ